MFVAVTVVRFCAINGADASRIRKRWLRIGETNCGRANTKGTKVELRGHEETCSVTLWLNLCDLRVRSGSCSVTDRLLSKMSPIGYSKPNVTDRLLFKMSPIGYIH